MSDPDVVMRDRPSQHWITWSYRICSSLKTAYHADVILPASAFSEKDGTFTNTNRQVQNG